MTTSKTGTGAEQPPQFVENPKTVADMIRNGLTIGVLRHEDHEGLEKLYRDRDEAHKKGDWELLRTTTDFPYTIVSDSADGDAISYSFEEAEFRERAANAMRLVPRAPVSHNRRFLFLSDHLAINLEENSVKVGEETLHFKAAHIVLKKEGRWRVNTVIEGGWAKAYQMTRAFQDR